MTSTEVSAENDLARSSRHDLLRANAVQLQLLIGIAILVAVFSLLYPDRFATFRNFQNITRQGATLLVVAIGQSFALVQGGFDISVGAVMGLASTVGALVMLEYGLWAGILAGIGAGLAAGVINGTLIAKLRVTPFVATLAMLAFARGAANQVSDGASVSGLPQAFRIFGGGSWGPIPATVGMAAVVLALAAFFLYFTRAGLYLFAIGGSRDATRLSGVKVSRYELLAYAVCGLLAGVGGLMLASRVSVGQASLGQGFELMSIATAVIGGFAIGGGEGRLSGVVLGVALLSVLSTGMNIAQISEFIQQMLTGVVLVAAVLIDRLRRQRRRARHESEVVGEEVAPPATLVS
ncbi:MAG TPA: ABC transporter permease [Acidimicrobiia bacterium]|nr:ABC transporter permease [Acidimicrobiia bacterium]